jgi:sporulation-control protein spo0M
MGLLDMFGKGGATVSVQLAAPIGYAGESIAGAVIVTGGKRAQQIDGVKVFLAQTKKYNLTKGGQAEDCEDRKGNYLELDVRFEVQPGGSQQVPFVLPIHKLVPSSRMKVNGEMTGIVCEYSVIATADIKGQIDPKGKAPIEITGGVELQLTTH